MRGLAAGFAAVMALLVVMALVVEHGGSSGSEMGRSRAALLELGEEPRTDLRLALALEVSKKRYNKAQKKLEGLRQQLTGDFDELKKWTVEKQEAKAQLEKAIAENDPTAVAENSDETVAAPLTVSRSGQDHLSVSRSGQDHAARADARGSALHLSSARHAKVERAAAASALTLRPRSSGEDMVVKKYNSEMGDIMKQQKETQSEVSALAQQMKAMIGSQAQLDREMAHAVKEMGARNAGAKVSTSPTHARTHRDSADEMSFEQSESDSVHKILQRELARLNRDKPVAPGAALAVVGKVPALARLRARAARLQAQTREASVRREMEAAILAGSSKEDLL